MNFFEGNPGFEKINGVYCQKYFNKKEFEEAYVDIRTKEGRMYDDEIVKELPFVPGSREWRIRANSAKKLVKQLRKENCRSLIEIGCGNGWLTNYIQKELNIEVCGIDIEKIELGQATRCAKGNAVFAYADIFSLKGLKADVVLLASCVQYFQNIFELLQHLKHIGTIHIIDSPFYKKGETQKARERSHAYFLSKDAVGMNNFYFHHELDALEIFDPIFLYRPGPFDKIFNASSPFPWIRIAPVKQEIS